MQARSLGLASCCCLFKDRYSSLILSIREIYLGSCYIKTAVCTLIVLNNFAVSVPDKMAKINNMLLYAYKLHVHTHINTTNPHTHTCTHTHTTHVRTHTCTNTFTCTRTRALCRIKLLPVAHVLVDTWMLTVDELSSVPDDLKWATNTHMTPFTLTFKA